MTSEELNRELVEIENVLSLVHAGHSDDFADLEDRLWLNRRRSYLAALAAIRRAQKGKKVVSPAVWRDGDRRSRLAFAEQPLARANTRDYEPASAS
ncbi:MAG TPA: hypothetical protein VGU20_10250 [Stellaceae bacterium]|nr:hypothetical protein [Stellaceae bacterium]